MTLTATRSKVACAVSAIAMVGKMLNLQYAYMIFVLFSTGADGPFVTPSHYAAKQFREMKSPADIAALEKELANSLLLLNKNQDSNKSEITALYLILKNLKEIKTEKLADLFRLNASHFEITERLANSKQPAVEILKEASLIENNLKAILRDDIFVEIIYKSKTIAAFVVANKEIEYSTEILSAIKIARENLGERNGLVCQLYLVQAKDFKAKSRVKECLQLIREMGATYEGLITPAHFLSIKTMNIDCLISLGQVGEAEKIFISADQKTIGLEDPALFFPRSELYESAVAIYQKKGDSANAIIYKESSLSALIKVLPFDNPLVQIKAKEFQRLLLDNQKWGELRNLEERFQLKPFPKQPGEA